MKVAFLDRDGTLVHEPATEQVTVETLAGDPDIVLPGVIDGLKALLAQGYALVMISNQGEDRMLSTPGERTRMFEATQSMLLAALERHGIRFSAVYMCPHAAKDRCGCRKPSPGILRDFLERHDVDRAQSFVVGDRPSDGEFAANIGVRFLRMAANGPFPDVGALLAGASAPEPRA